MTRLYQPGNTATSTFWDHRATLVPLKQAAAAAGLGFGMSAQFANLASAHQQDVILRECSIVTNSGNHLMQNIHASQASYYWVAADTYSDFAVANGLGQVQGGHLLWHFGTPSWMTAITNPVLNRAACESHITTVMQHLGPKGVTHWNVVNEVINADTTNDDVDKGYYAASWLYQIHGTAFTRWAFEAARAARPTDTLIWNTHAVQRGGVYGTYYRQRQLEALRDALDDGAPIDGFGAQMHLWQGGDQASGAEMADWFNEVAALGLRIFITELDITDQLMTYATRDQTIYDCILDVIGSVCRDVPALEHIVVWGMTDSDSWLNGNSTRTDGYALKPLPFDRQGYPNPMAQALLDSFALRARFA